MKIIIAQFLIGIHFAEPGWYSFTINKDYEVLTYPELNFKKL